MQINPKYVPGGPDKHAIFSASAAHRWLTCAGSIPLSLGGTLDKPSGDEDGSSEAAAEGTMLHAVANYCLEQGIDVGALPQDFFADDWFLTDEQESAVQFCLDYVYLQPEHTGLYETKIQYHEALGVAPSLAFGTNDIALLYGDTLHIIDMKFGRRHVTAHKNEQMELYAIGMLGALEAIGESPQSIRMTILQPRTTGEPEEWEISPGDLRYDMYREGADRVKQATREYGQPGWDDKWLNPEPDACQFCPAKAICPALQNLTTDLAAKAADLAEFDIEDFKIEDSLAVADVVRMHLDAVDEEAKRRIAQGVSVPGWKLVQGRKGNRKWNGDDTTVASSLAEMGLEDPYSEPALLTPAKAEAALGAVIQAEEGGTKKAAKAEAADRMGGLVTRNAPKPTLVTEDTPGEPWSAGADLEEF